MMRRLGFLAALFVAATTLRAQDIEMMARRNARPLPPGYYQRLLFEPDAFELKRGWRNRLARAEVTASSVAGILPLVVIPALFSDSEAPTDIISTPVLQARLFDELSPTTVTAFYREVSLGKLTIGGRVTPWATTNMPLQDVVGESMGLGSDAKVRQWLTQAVASVDASVDFGQFDNDGPDGIPNSGDDDGRVDGAAFLFREIDAACGGPGIWPHRSRIASGTTPAAATNDRRPNGQPIVVDDYMVLGARVCSGTRALDVNVFAHETGHVLGLPDYYDASGGLLRTQRRWVVGCWELMSAGSWGCGRGPQGDVVLPSHMGPYPKSLLGWIAPKVVAVGLRPEQHTLRPAYSSGDALRVPLSPSEYLLVEYRARLGFDAGLPASGLLVYHVETGRSFLPCQTCPRRYSYSLLEADGDTALLRVETSGGNRGEGTDVFGVPRAVLDDVTLPSSRLNNGTSTGVRLTGMIVDAAAGLARVTVSLSPARFAVEALISALGLTPLASADQTLLDSAGNANGRYDVGDLRAFLRIRAENP
ncbi:MAG TPA: M6 family metalloprotease domain-containing protein [Gemmatimonadaceae bacterium]|nr:M6 family metalloprotease domain-containing protein [Gemmatimonadaceae bacterium]